MPDARIADLFTGVGVPQPNGVVDARRRDPVTVGAEFREVDALVIRRTGVTDGGSEADEEVRARLLATKAALKQIDALADEEWTRDDTIERMRGQYEFRKRRLAARAGKIEDDGYEDRSQD